MADIILSVFVGLILGIWITDRFHRRIMQDFLEAMQFSDQDLARLKQRLSQRLNSTDSELAVIEVRLEQHGDELYAFRKDTEQFLGQGPDRDALIQRLNETMQPCKINITLEDGAELLQKRNG
jgi:hypothetical protein